MPKKREFHKTSEGVYWRSKKLSSGQTAVMFFSNYGKRYEVGFAIGKNRKQCMSWYEGETEFLQGKISGKGTNAFEVYSFAKSTLKSFEKFIFDLKGETTIIVDWEEDRRGKIYIKALTRKDMRYVRIGSRLIKKIKGA